MPQTFYVSQPDEELCIVIKNGSERTSSILSARIPTVHVRRTDQAHVLERRPGEIYVHYLNTDKRMDEWMPESCVRIPEGVKPEPGSTVVLPRGASAATSHVNGTKKRKRSMSIDVVSRSHEHRRAHAAQLVPSEIGGAPVPDDDPRTLKMSEEEYDMEHHKRITARRNFEKVIFGKWSIRTWYYSSCKRRTITIYFWCESRCN